MTRWYREKKEEHYYKEAKRVGYRARSAFKLKQIQNKFTVIRRGDTVIDLGAAPGGWSQVAQELVGPQGSVIGIDISPVKPLENVHFIQSDITDTATLDRIQHVIKGTKADVVLSDMSPNISGSYSIDQARSIWLCEKALEVAREFLKPQGHFVCKLFEGEDTKSFLEHVKQNFYRVKQFSPQASRKSSSEIYIIAQSLKPDHSYNRE
jgi:23S rRNA (uridine2552-2'-O)-methyltransferase